MSTGFKDYLREAFNARPLGMFVPPNWIGLGVFAALGFLNPGFWLLGAGLEFGYLYALVGSDRFRRVVEAMGVGAAAREWDARLGGILERLPAKDVDRFRELDGRCRVILAHQRATDGAPEMEMQAAGLGKLLWIYIGLLQTRQSLQQVVEEAGNTAVVRLRQIERQIEDEQEPNVRQSLESQREILRQRIATHEEGRGKIQFLEAELSRIEQQAELIREQSLLAAQPVSVSRRIDEVAATLGGTTQWIREQQKIYGEVQDLLEEPPAIPLQQSQ